MSDDFRGNRPVKDWRAEHWTDAVQAAADKAKAAARAAAKKAKPAKKK